MLIMMLALCLTVQGPGTNLLHNVSQVAKALSCGAELAQNQTAERLQRAKEPLLSEQGAGGRWRDWRGPSWGSHRQPQATLTLWGMLRCPLSLQMCRGKSRRLARMPRWWVTVSVSLSAPS